MSILARKITRAKWEPRPELAAGEIAADAITVDLRTSDNTLSFWRFDSAGEDELASAVLALAAAADRADKVDLVYVDEDVVRASSLATANTTGATPVASLRSHHVDVERLDYVRLGTVATLIAGALKAENFRRVSRAKVLTLLVEAVRAGRVAMDDMKPDLRDEVLKRLGPPPG